MIKKLLGFFLDKSLLIFLIIGGLNTIISMAGSQMLVGPMTTAWGESVGYWGSTSIMFILCSFTSFYFNRKYSFESKAPLLPSAIRFAVVILVCYLIGFGISDVFTPWIVTVLGGAIPEIWITRIAMLVGQVIFTGLNYIGQRLWAFKD